MKEAAPRARAIATLVGTAAVMCWASESALVTYAVRIPPFQIAFLGLGAVAALIIPYLLLRPRKALLLLRQPRGAWALSVFGLLGFHVCLYHAVETAPPAQAALLLGFTPLMIVVGSALLPGEHLRWWHLAGVIMGLSGASWLVVADLSLPGGENTTGNPVHLLAALAAAMIWAIYSLGNRRFPDVPTLAVGPFCAAASLAAGIGHMLFEHWVAPNPAEWRAILALGLLPAGFASFLWDHAVKRGDIQVLGVIAYGEPLLGAAFVILVGAESAGWRIVWAAILIVGGAMLASHHLWRRRPMLEESQVK
jgi:drug/metabolite transporter (DMT)-like permease